MTLVAPADANPHRDVRDLIRIFVLGMPERSFEALQLLIDRQHPRMFEVCPSPDAEVTLLDLDVLGGHQLLDEHRHEFPDRVIVGISLHDRGRDLLDGLVTKPARLDDLTVAILDAVERSRLARPAGDAAPVEDTTTRHVNGDDTTAEQAAPAGETTTEHTTTEVSDENATAENTITEDTTTEDTTTEQPAPAELRFDPPLTPWVPARNRDVSANRAAREVGARLAMTTASRPMVLDRADPPAVGSSLLALVQRSVQTARAKRRGVELRHTAGTIVIEPDQHLVATDLQERQLRRLACQPDAGGQWSVRATRRRFPLEHATELLTVEELLWQLGAWTHGSGLPAGTPVDVPVGLRRWPDLARNLPIEGAARIAARWTAQPTSIEETAELLHLDRRRVNAFYAAASAAGLVVFPTRSGAAGPARGAHIRQEPSRRRLFGSILARLRDS